MSAKVQWYREAWWVITHAKGKKRKKRDPGEYPGTPACDPLWLLVDNVERCLPESRARALRILWAANASTSECCRFTL